MKCQVISMALSFLYRETKLPYYFFVECTVSNKSDHVKSKSCQLGFDKVGYN